MQRIFRVMSGTEWDSSTLEAIAKLRIHDHIIIGNRTDAFVRMTARGDLS